MAARDHQPIVGRNVEGKDSVRIEVREFPGSFAIKRRQPDVPDAVLVSGIEDRLAIGRPLNSATSPAGTGALSVFTSLPAMGTVAAQP
jgi:hypothetical protein